MLPPPGSCSFDGCTKPARTKGLCAGHYSQRRHGQQLQALGKNQPLGRSCSFDGCTRPVAAEGLCAGHSAQQLTDEPLSPLHGTRSAGDPCEFDGCVEPIKARGLCQRHYDQVQHGVTLHRLGPKSAKWAAGTSIQTKLIARLTNYPDTETCWEVSGGTDRHGYGVIYHDGRKWQTHRVAHTLWIGPIPAGHVVLHECANPLCANPAHLTTGILADVDTDEAKLLRAKPAKLTPDDVRAIRADDRARIEIARAYGVTPNAIGNLLLGNTYKHVQ